MSKFIFKEALIEYYSFRVGEPVGLMQTVTGIHCDDIKAIELYNINDDKSLYVVTANKGNTAYVFNITEDELSGADFVIKTKEDVSIFVSPKLSAYVPVNKGKVFVFTDFAQMNKAFSKWLYDADVEAYNMIAASQRFVPNVKFSIEIPVDRYLQYLEWNATTHDPDYIKIKGVLSSTVPYNCPLISLAKLSPDVSIIRDLTDKKMYADEHIADYHASKLDGDHIIYLNLDTDGTIVSEELLDSVCDYLYNDASSEDNFSIVLSFNSKEAYK